MDREGPEPGPSRGGDASAFPGSEWLRGPSPRAILHNLLDHDPFELGGRSVARLEQRALLLSGNKLWLRALARVAHAALGYHGEPALETWLRQKMDVSLEEILEEELQAELEGQPLDVPPEPHHLFVSQHFGVEPGMARRACLRFNGLPESVRRVFFAIAVHKKSVNRCVAEGNGPPERVRDDFELAVRALSAYPEPDDLDLLGLPW